jgi:hypothetical protein
MTLWSIFRSPLMFGGNLPDNDEFTTSLITNEEIIRVNQNSTENKEISFKNSISIWTAKDIENPVKYLAMLNISDSVVHITCTPEELGVSSGSLVRDLWKKSDIGPVGNSIVLSIPAHGAVLYSVK